jgi:hypothetical protein
MKYLLLLQFLFHTKLSLALDLRLSGTILSTSKPETSIAVIHDRERSQTKMGRVGDPVFGFQIKKIEGKKVWLSSPEQDLWVTFSEDPTPDKRLVAIGISDPKTEANFSEYEAINADIPEGQPNLPLPESP